MTFDDVPPNCDPRVLREIIRVNPPMMSQIEHGNPELAAAAKKDDPEAFVAVLNRQNAVRSRNCLIAATGCGWFLLGPVRRHKMRLVPAV